MTDVEKSYWWRVTGSGVRKLKVTGLHIAVSTYAPIYVLLYFSNLNNPTKIVLC